MRVGNSLRQVLHGETQKDWLVRLVLYIFVVLCLSLVVQVLTLYVLR